jgi:hypothetical protein
MIVADCSVVQLCIAHSVAFVWRCYARLLHCAHSAMSYTQQLRVAPYAAAQRAQLVSANRLQLRCC